MCGSGKLQQAIQAAFERQYCETGRGAFAHALGVQKDGFFKYNKEEKREEEEERRKGRGNALRTMGEERDDNIIYIFVK